MSKWKCGICDKEFDNFQAQGFNGVIYCPLCYYKELYNRERLKNEKAIEYIKELISATKGTLNDMNYCDKKETITQYVENLEYDINHYKYLLNILNGRSDE